MKEDLASPKPIKITRVAACVAGFLCLCVLYSVYSMNLGYNSDGLHALLQARDILKGNVLLNGWRLGTVNGMTTWNLSHVIGIILFGNKLNTTFLVAGIVCTFLVTVAVFLGGYGECYGEGKSRFSWYNAMVTFAVVGVPPALAASNYLMANLHVEAYLYCLVTFVLIGMLDQRLGEGKSNLRWLYILIGFMILISDYGDAMCIFLLSLPVMAVSLIHILYKKQIKSNLILFVTSGVLALLSALLNKLGNQFGIYYHDGTGSVYVFNWNNLGSNLSYTISGYLAHFNSQITGAKIASLTVVTGFVGLLAMLACVLLLTGCIRRFIQLSVVTQLLIAGILAQTLAYAFSGLPQGENSRYLTPAFIFLAVVAGRANALDAVKKIMERFPLLRDWEKRAGYVLCALCLIFAVTKFTPLSLTRPVQAQDKLAGYLVKHHLTSGYAGYWDANSVTVASDDKVKVYSVWYPNYQAQPFQWFTKLSWYTRPAYFVITQEPGWGSVNGQWTKKFFGKPSKIAKVGSYNIYIYNHDISSKLNKPMSPVL